MRQLLVVAICVMCLICIGCGPDAKLGEVTGKVTLDGQPVKGAVVTFTPVDGGRASVGKTDDNGVYNLAFGAEPGALVGTHKVTVQAVTSTGGTTFDPNIRSDSPEYEKQAMGGSQADYNNAKSTETIPAKYNKETTLEYEVKSGKNTIDIEMTSN